MNKIKEQIIPFAKQPDFEEFAPVFGQLVSRVPGIFENQVVLLWEEWEEDGGKINYVIHQKLGTIEFHYTVNREELDALKAEVKEEILKEYAEDYEQD